MFIIKQDQTRLWATWMLRFFSSMAHACLWRNTWLQGTLMGQQGPKTNLPWVNHLKRRGNLTGYAFRPSLQRLMMFIIKQDQTRLWATWMLRFFSSMAHACLWRNTWLQGTLMGQQGPKANLPWVNHLKRRGTLTGYAFRPSLKRLMMFIIKQDQTRLWATWMLRFFRGNTWLRGSLLGQQGPKANLPWVNHLKRRGTLTGYAFRPSLQRLMMFIIKQYQTRLWATWMLRFFSSMAHACLWRNTWLQGTLMGQQGPKANLPWVNHLKRRGTLTGYAFRPSLKRDVYHQTRPKTRLWATWIVKFPLGLGFCWATFCMENGTLFGVKKSPVFLWGGLFTSPTPRRKLPTWMLRFFSSMAHACLWRNTWLQGTLMGQQGPKANLPWVTI